MKTRILALVCCTLTLNAALAQNDGLAADSASKMGLGVTIAPQPATETAAPAKSTWQWSDHPSTLTITFGAPSVLGLSYTQGRGCYGAYSLRYEYNVLRWLAIGLRAQYEGWEGVNRIDATLQVDFTYVNREKVQVYSGAGFGFAYVIDGSNRIGLAGQLTPIGVRIGSKRIYGMAEVNVGTAALFSVGLCVKL